VSFIRTMPAPMSTSKRQTWFSSSTPAIAHKLLGFLGLQVGARRLSALSVHTRKRSGMPLISLEFNTGCSHPDSQTPSPSALAKAIPRLYRLSRLSKSCGARAYPIGSLAIVAPWHIWAQLKGLRGLELVCESFGRNMLSRFPGQQRPMGGKENEPFEGRGH
jgi:hypothetical protein